MRVLLGSGGFRTPERVAAWSEAVRSFIGSKRRVLFVPYALADHEGYLRTMPERGLHAGYELDGLHRHADPQRAVRDAEAVLVGGGNTFRLLATLHRLGLVDAIRERVSSGVPYVGISAGTNVACPTIRTTNDIPIVEPPGLSALGLVRFQVNPHYYTGATLVRVGETLVEHFGETRDDRIREFHEENDAPVVGLWEAGILRIEDDTVTLLTERARLFRRGRDPLDLSAVADLTPLLKA